MAVFSGGFHDFSPPCGETKFRILTNSGQKSSKKGSNHREEILMGLFNSVYRLSRCPACDQIAEEEIQIKDVGFVRQFKYLLGEHILDDKGAPIFFTGDVEGTGGIECANCGFNSVDENEYYDRVVVIRDGIIVDIVG
jgi:hypothetical protein